ncbi:hypothetical protein D6783_05570, partial [Candidatus Woesearchaeota archaeon]
MDVVAVDEADNNATDTSATFTIDDINPVLSNITSTDVNISIATIVWTSDELSNSTVVFGTAPDNLTFSAVNASLVVNHSVLLTGLTQNTTYYYNVSSCDRAENCQTNGTFNFTTLLGPSAPVITTSPNTSALEDTPYFYDVNATDANNDPLTYNLTTAPSGMTINTSTGLISWTPTQSQVGNHTVAIIVEDGTGLNDTQNYTLTVSNVNDDPVITTSPVTSATVNEPYVYDVNATDSDPTNDTLTYALELAPSGMSINASSGLIEWTPSVGQEGAHNVSVNVSDGNGGVDRQNYTVTVASDTTPPGITNIANSSTNESATISWNTTEDANATVFYGLSPANLSLSASNATIGTVHVVVLTNLTNGTRYYYNVSSCDPSGNCNVSGTYNFSTSNNPDTEAPSVTSPAVNDSVLHANASLQINVTVTDNRNVSSVTVGNASRVSMNASGGDLWSVNTTPAALGCAEGVCVLLFNATDASNNSNASVSTSILVDSVSPVIVSVSLSDNVTRNNTNVSVTVNV